MGAITVVNLTEVLKGFDLTEKKIDSAAMIATWQAAQAIEALAKSDSSAVASRAMTLDKTLSKKMAARKGNEAANKRRKQENLPLVTRGQQPQSGLPGGVKFKRPDIYSRDGQLEKDPKRSTVMTYRNSR